MIERNSKSNKPSRRLPSKTIIMRTARIRLDHWEPTYYHCVNRVAGDPKYFPFGDIEKEKLFNLLTQLSVFYCVDIISFVVMSNHIHLICAANPGLPPLDEVRRRWRAFNDPDAHEPLWETSGTYERVAFRMRNISCLLKDLQQRFTCWFNRTRPSKRRGTLWSGRFKSNVLEKGEALWSCVKYVEMNPVRAKICDRAEDYRFSTWGRLHGSGHHPFSNSFQKHIRLYLGERAFGWDDQQVVAEMNAAMAMQAAAEAGASQDEIQETGIEARACPRFKTTLLRRVRYWTDGTVIGSKTFLREVEAIIRQRASASKRFDRSDNTSIFSYRQLRT